MKKIVYLLILVMTFSGCSVDSFESNENITSANAKTNKEQNNSPVELETPTILCGTATSESWPITVAVGSLGAPGGFSIEWMTMDDFESNGYEWVGELSCGYRSDVAVAANSSTSIDLANFIGQDEQDCYLQWDCEEVYVFRIKADNVQGNEFRQSKWSENFDCQAQPCEMICPYGKGYWKNHSETNPSDNQEDMWPEMYEEKMTLGTEEYLRDELDNIMDLSNDEGNGIRILAQHLIAAKLNVAIGASMDGIDEAISQADILIGEKDIMTGTFTDEQKEDSEAIKDILETFNELCED